jgi:hypothetical protein
MGGRAGQRIFAGCGLPRLRAFAGGLVLSQWRSLALVNLRLSPATTAELLVIAIDLLAFPGS